MHESESEVALSCPTLSDSMDCSLPVPPPMGFSRQEYWSGVPLNALDLIKNVVQRHIYNTFETAFIVDKLHEEKKIIHCELASLLFSTTKYYHQLESLLNYNN